MLAFTSNDYASRMKRTHDCSAGGDECAHDIPPEAVAQPMKSKRLCSSTASSGMSCAQSRPSSSNKQNDSHTLSTSPCDSRSEETAAEETAIILGAVACLCPAPIIKTEFVQASPHQSMTWEQWKQEIKGVETCREEKVAESERLQQRVNAGCVAVGSLEKELARLQQAIAHRKQVVKCDKEKIQQTKDERKVLCGRFEELMRQMDHL